MFNKKEETIIQTKFDSIGEFGERLGSRVNHLVSTVIKAIVIVASFIIIGGLTFIRGFSHGLVKRT